jgi:hypothetical protein
MATWLRHNPKNYYYYVLIRITTYKHTYIHASMHSCLSINAINHKKI